MTEALEHTKRSIKILHLIVQANLGGAQLNTHYTVAGLRKRGYHVELACGGEGDQMPAAAREVQIPVTIFPSLVRNPSPILDSLCLFELCQYLRESRFDIVHTHGLKANILGCFAAKLVRTPVVIQTAHGTSCFLSNGKLLNWLSIKAGQFSARFTDKFIAVADLVKEDWINAGICSSEDIEAIYSGIDFSSFDVSVDVTLKRRELGFDVCDFIIGAVGNLNEFKGHKYLIEAVHQVRKRYTNVKLIIAGDGYLREELQLQIAELGLKDIAFLLGERRDIPKLLSIMDIYVQPSLWEGLGRAMTEAMYMERPVIASSINAIPEIVKDGKTGLLVPPRDVGAIAKAVEYLIENPEKASYLSKNAREEVFPKFSAEAMVDQIEDLYLRMLEEKKCQPK